MGTDPILSVEGLKVYFREDRSLARAVDGVDFDIGPQETVCLVGESGCGKTVTALAMLGLLPCPPAEIAGGRILFKNRDLLALDEQALRTIRGSQIAMIFQEPLTSLNPVFTIGDQIAETVTAHGELPPGEVRRRCLDLLADVGIPTPRTQFGAYPHQLSGGQRQRVMIAMALGGDPDLIIADEPTTALDVTVQAKILDLLKSLQNQRKMSIQYITHDLGVVANIADRVYVMYAGIIVEQGKTEQIFGSPAHPYTRGLLASLPTRAKRNQRLQSIPGAVPNPAHKPAGCPFHPRCPHAITVCRSSMPAMCDCGQGHRARCPVIYQRQDGRG